LAKIAQLDRADEIIHAQFHIIEQKIAGLEQMRASLQTKLEQHKPKRNQLLEHT
jgi:MerR family transcriptional regulator, repressor of the yfmOP operon